MHRYRLLEVASLFCSGPTFLSVAVLLAFCLARFLSLPTLVLVSIARSMPSFALTATFSRPPLRFCLIDAAKSVSFTGRRLHT